MEDGKTAQMSLLDDTKPDALRLRKEQVRLIYSLSPVNMMATVVNSAIITVALWDLAHHAVLIAWLVLSLAVVWLRFLLVKAYKRASPENMKVDIWGNLFTLGLAFSGILMGAAGVLLFPSASFAHQMLLTFLIGGMAAGAAATYSVLMGAFLAYSIPAVLPVLVRLLTMESNVHTAMGVMLMVFSTVIAAAAYRYHKTTVKSLELRFENSDLVSRLISGKAEIEGTVEALLHEVSDHKDTEEALRQSEQKFRMLVETMNEGLGMLDTKGIINYVNDRLCSMLGYSRDELIGMHVSELSDEVNVFEEEMSRRQMRRRTSTELELTTKNRRRIPAIASRTPVFDTRGDFSGVIIAVTDISVFKWAKKNLRESEEKYRLIFENSPLGIIHIDSNATITACNENIAGMSGVSKEKLIGLNIMSFIKDEKLKKVISECLSGKLAHYEGYYEWEIGEGRVTPLKAEYGPIWAEDGSVIGGIGIVEDISERLRMEEELQEQLRFLQTLVDTIPNPIFYKDSKGVYLGCNKTFAAQLGLKRRDIIGKSVHDLLPKRLAGEYHAIDVELFRQPGRRTYESEIFDAEGSKRNVIIYKATFTNLEGSVAGLVGVIVDITEQKQAEADLRKAHTELETRVGERTGELANANLVLLNEINERKRAEEALRISSEKLKLFAYSVAHDLKSPIVGIYGLTRLLYKNYAHLLDENGRNYCEKVLRASEYAAEFVEKINVYAATKEAPLVFEKIDVNEILRMIRDEFSPQLSIRGVEWIEPESAIEIKADRLSLLRIFRNLVDNALKYGGEQVSEIRIGYDESEEFHILSVSDNGVGVKREDCEKIFEVFQRNEASKTIEGTGLGLAIVKEITERHKGGVRMESAVERGTTFYVTISKFL